MELYILAVLDSEFILKGIAGDENNQVFCAAHHSEQSFQIVSA